MVTRASIWVLTFKGFVISHAEILGATHILQKTVLWTNTRVIQPEQQDFLLADMIQWEGSQLQKLQWIGDGYAASPIDGE